MSDLSSVAKLLESIGSILWPILVLIFILKLWPVIESVLLTAKSRKFTIKVAGQEISMEEASQQNRSLIEDIQTKVIELSHIVESRSESSPTIVRGKESLAIHKFSGGDLERQRLRISLAENIGLIIESGLNEFSPPQVQQLTVSQHNTSLSYVISPSRIQDHREEVEALYDFLMKKLIAAPPTKFNGEIASILGIMKYNMICMLN